MADPLPQMQGFRPQRRHLRHRWARLLTARFIWALPFVFLAIGAAGLLMVSRGW